MATGEDWSVGRLIQACIDVMVFLQVGSREPFGDAVRSDALEMVMSGRRILLTGVSRGIGRALCHEFSRLGHAVAGCARNQSALEELTSELGPEHHFARVDVSSDSAVESWIEKIVSQWGTPDLVINNAALINKNAPLWDVPIEEFQQLVDVNITGVFSVIRHVVPHMINKGSGVIVNLSSGWGRSVSAEVAPYCATKFAIEGMTQALAEDLPTGIAAIPVNPGTINTAMLQSCFGTSASDSPSPEAWAKRAAPFYLGLGAKDNGQPLTVP